MTGVRIAAIIPVRMGSVRLPGKPLLSLHNLPMVEHVRRRALLCPALQQVVVATCDQEIAKAVESYGGLVIMTSPLHRTGTDRAAEAASHLDSTHVLIVQGDEPLVLPEHLSRIARAIQDQAEVKAWNGVGLIEHEADLRKQSVVKCITSRSGRILFCSRDFSSIEWGSQTKEFIRKILGLIAFERHLLERFPGLESAPYEIAASIEQSRLLEYDITLSSVDLIPSYPGINEPGDAEVVQRVFAEDPVQRAILEKTLNAR